MFNVRIATNWVVFYKVQTFLFLAMNTMIFYRIIALARLRNFISMICRINGQFFNLFHHCQCFFIGFDESFRAPHFCRHITGTCFAAIFKVTMVCKYHEHSFHMIQNILRLHITSYGNTDARIRTNTATRIYIKGMMFC